ncbi:MAG: hypothetical protein WBW84_15680, partial [Acidobacteriaceae bacterium]
MFDKPTIAHGVAPVLGVLASIELDDEPFLSADKIGDIRSDRLLTHEFKFAERPRTKVAPKSSLRDCGVSSQLSSQTRLRCVCATHAAKPPHPDLLPARRGEGVASGETELF